MVKVLIVYDSRSGNTEKMAKAVEQGARGAGASVRLLMVNEAHLSDLEWADGVIFGSPTYFGAMSARMKGFIDKSVGLFTKGKLQNKVGAAFTSADGTGTGAEMTALSLISALVQYEAIIVSAPGRDSGWPGTYGVIADNLYSIGSLDEKMLDNCRRLGERVAEVAKKLA
jgi:NAD(P)H dehydrogenase (quinone)